MSQVVRKRGFERNRTGSNRSAVESHSESICLCKTMIRVCVNPAQICAVIPCEITDTDSRLKPHYEMYLFNWTLKKIYIYMLCSLAAERTPQNSSFLLCQHFWTDHRIRQVDYLNKKKKQPWLSDDVIKCSTVSVQDSVQMGRKNTNKRWHLRMHVRRKSQHVTFKSSHRQSLLDLSSFSKLAFGSGSGMFYCWKEHQAVKLPLINSLC